MNLASKQINRLSQGNLFAPHRSKAKEAFWNLGFKNTLIRQVDTIRLQRKFRTQRANFFRTFWHDQAEKLGGELTDHEQYYELKLADKTLYAVEGRVLTDEKWHNEQDHPKNLPNWGWRQSHPMYSLDYRSLVNLLFVDGKFSCAVRSLPPAIIGDGKRTIYQLVRRENERRLTARGWLGINPLLVDNRTRLYLLINNLLLDDVPELGQHIQVKFGVEENNRYANQTVTDTISFDLLSACTKLLSQTKGRIQTITLGCDKKKGRIERQQCALLGVNGQPDLTPFILAREPKTGVDALNAVFENWFDQR